MKWIYTQDGKWWFGGFDRFGMLPESKLLPEFWWMLKNGEWHFDWHWPMIFGIGRDWHDGPIWHAHLGFFAISIISG